MAGEKGGAEKSYAEDIEHGNGNWTVWSKYVLKELIRLGNSCETADTKLDSLTVLFTKEIATIKTKVALISAGVAFVLGFVGPIIIFFLTKGSTR